MLLLLNPLMFAVIMSRMGPFQALNSMVPLPADRGAYMSVSASLSQLSGGLGIVIAGSIVFQPAPASPLQHFGLLGYVAVGLSVLAACLVYRLNRMLRGTAQ